MVGLNMQTCFAKMLLTTFRNALLVSISTTFCAKIVAGAHMADFAV